MGVIVSSWEGCLQYNRDTEVQQVNVPGEHTVITQELIFTESSVQSQSFFIMVSIYEADTIPIL